MGEHMNDLEDLPNGGKGIMAYVVIYRLGSEDRRYQHHVALRPSATEEDIAAAIAAHRGVPETDVRVIVVAGTATAPPPIVRRTKSPQRLYAAMDEGDWPRDPDLLRTLARRISDRARRAEIRGDQALGEAMRAKCQRVLALRAEIVAEQRRHALRAIDGTASGRATNAHPEADTPPGP